MADEEETEATEEAAPPKGKLPGKKKIMFLGAGLVLLLLIGGGVYFFVLGGGETPGEIAAAEESEAEKAAVEAAKAADAVFFEMPGMLVNLAGDGQRQAYLRVSTTLEVRSVVDLGDVRDRSAAIVDGFQTFLREMRPRDIAGSGGLMRLKEELLVRANAAIGRNVVRNVLLTEFLVQ